MGLILPAAVASFVVTPGEIARRRRKHLFTGGKSGRVEEEVDAEFQDGWRGRQAHTRPSYFVAPIGPISPMLYAGTILKSPMSW